MSHFPATLPAHGPVERWVPARKAEVVRRIEAGEATIAETLRRWDISVEELDAWLQAYRTEGRRGLKAMKQPAQGRLL